jgi:hypothetical protein
MQAPRCRGVRIPPRLPPLLEAFDVLPVVAALLWPAGHDFRPQLAAARVRVQRRPRDAEGVRRLRRSQETRVRRQLKLIL